MIATRREFMKLSAGGVAGLVLTPVATNGISQEPIFEGQECPVPIEPGGHRFMQRLRPDDLILGHVLIYQWDAFREQFAAGMTASLARQESERDILSVLLCQHSHAKWSATPGTEIVVLHREEVIFKCSDLSGRSSVCFEKL